MRARLFTLCLPLLCLALLTQCETVRFYAQGVKGHWQVQSNAHPIAKVLEAPSTSEEIRRQLALVLEIRAFAANRLGLPVDGQYDRYADLQRDHLVWVVFAAPELSLKPQTWHYPLLGRLSYRGYFRESDASQLAARLAAKGHDTFIAPVDAYSTLGWFSDPVLNTFIDLPPRDLAELLFHELTHQRLYFPGDTDFNEALATAFGQHGTRLWLRESGRQAELRAYDRESRIVNAFVRDIESCRSLLKQVYEAPTLSAADKRRAKAAAFAALRARAEQLNRTHGGTLKIHKWFERPVNNARLNSIATYHDLVPEFTAVLEDHCQGDIQRFFRQLEALKGLTPEQRLEWLHSPTSGGSPSKHSLVTPP